MTAQAVLARLFIGLMILSFIACSHQPDSAKYSNLPPLKSDVLVYSDPSDPQALRVVKIARPLLAGRPLPIRHLFIMTSQLKNPQTGEGIFYAETNAASLRCGPGNPPIDGCVFIGALLVQLLSDEALAGVLAHELGHLEKGHLPMSSIDQEYEADAAGWARLAVAGYCAGKVAKAALNETYTLAAMHGPLKIVASHPSYEERLKSVKPDCADSASPSVAAGPEGASLQTAKTTAEAKRDLVSQPRAGNPSLGKDKGGEDKVPMVSVPQGEFTMGNARGHKAESFVHKVNLNGFYIDKYKVTVSRYAAFMSSTGREEPAYWTKDQHSSTFDNYPIVGVSWFDADEYCRWAGKRLPTEAEWEKAARGIDERTYPWGNEQPDLLVANYDLVREKFWKGYSSLSDVSINPMGASPYGAYQMAGNVQEWTADWYDAEYYRQSPSSNPLGPASPHGPPAKIIRGGSWNFGADELPAFRRNQVDPKGRYNFVGFRCAKDTEK